LELEGKNRQKSKPRILHTEFTCLSGKGPEWGGAKISEQTLMQDAQTNENDKK
jgi:hypothetical protein